MSIKLSAPRELRRMVKQMRAQAKRDHAQADRILAQGAPNMIERAYTPRVVANVLDWWCDKLERRARRLERP
jgi:hypothetical protein